MATPEPHRQSRWLKAMPPEAAALLLDGARDLTLPRDRQVFDLDGDPGAMYGIRSGAVAVEIDDENQGIVIGHLLSAGAWFGEAAVILDTPRFVGVVTLTECRLVSVSRNQVLKVAAQHPDVWRALAVLATSNTGVAIRTARDLLIRDPEMRCRAVLNRMAGAAARPARLPITQTQLGDMCSLSRGAVSAILARMQAAGQIARGYGEIVVL